MNGLRRLAPGVLVGTSRFMATNTVVVHHDGRALVIDPGVHDDELHLLSGTLAGDDLEVVAGFATHAHWDHVLWHDALGDVPRWATPQTVRTTREHLAELFVQAEEITPVDRTSLGDLTPLPDPTVPWPGPEMIVVEHHAHRRGHAALHVPELGLLIAGDTVSDVEIPLLDHDVAVPQAVSDYHDGLDRLATLPTVDLVVPGHGTPCDRAGFVARIDADRRYLDDLVRDGRSSDPRIEDGWLRDAHEAMAAASTKPVWRRWVAGLPDPVGAAAVRGHLAEFLGADPGRVAVYDALPGEVDLADLALTTRVLPRIAADGLVSWHEDTGRWEPHRFGMRQPPADAPLVVPTEIDVVVVPGRLFDRSGVRLGRGGGHYDRLLPRLRPGVPVVGVTVQERIVPRVPTDDHDRPMTHLATETGVHPV